MTRLALILLLLTASSLAIAHLDVEDGALKPPAPPPTTEECAALAELSKEDAELYSMRMLREQCKALGLPVEKQLEKAVPRDPAKRS